MFSSRSLKDLSSLIYQIFSVSSFSLIKWHAWFTTVPLKAVSDLQVWIKYPYFCFWWKQDYFHLWFLIYTKVTCALLQKQIIGIKPLQVRKTTLSSTLFIRKRVTRYRGEYGLFYGNLAYNPFKPGF